MPLVRIFVLQKDREQHNREGVEKCKMME